ncbi:MAG: V-type ATPase 116kDa subunit family protein [Candidatus Anstonellales archaeon]
MFLRKPNRILKIMFLSEKTKTLELLSTLHQMEIAEITKINEISEINKLLSNTQLRNYEAINEHYLKFNDFIKEIEISIELTDELIDIKKDITDIELLLLLETNTKLFDNLRDLAKRKKELKEEIRLLEQQLIKLEELIDSEIDPKVFTLKSAKLKLFKYCGSVDESTKHITNQLQKFEIIDPNHNGILIIADNKKESKEQNNSYVLALNIEIPNDQKLIELHFENYADKNSLLQDYKNKQRLKEEKLDTLSKISIDFDELIKSNKKLLTEIKYHLECWKMRYNIILEQKSTSNIDILTAWIDENDLDRVRSRIKNEFGNSVKLLIISDSYHEENAPTKIENKEKLVKNFEGMLKTITIPSATDFDPSLILTLLLPIMYGMIVGDVGYALISIPFAMFLKSKFKDSKTIQYVSNIWIFSAIFAIIFGLLFDEFFGLSFINFMKIFNIEVNKRPLEYLGIDWNLHRVHELPRLMGYTILFGALIVSIGFLLGSLISLEHDIKHAIGKASWILFILSLLILLPKNLFNYTLIPLNGIENEIGLFALGLSVLVILLTEGVSGIFELAGVVSNIMSFLRIAGVGVAGVIVAEIINASFTPNILSNFLNFLIMAIIFMTLHFANAVIAMVEGMIQGGRLCLVEFGTKYFKGGGRLFNPFSLPIKKSNN